MLWASTETLDPEPLTDEDTFDDAPSGQHLHRKWEDGEALDICFSCGDPVCTDAGEYVEWQNFEPAEDHNPNPDPTWVTVCEDCASLGWDDLFPFEDYT